VLAHAEAQAVTAKMHSRGGALAAALVVAAAVGFARAGNPDAKRLYDDLLSNYNKLVRPVVNVSEAVTVRLKLKLSQLIDVVSHPSARGSAFSPHRSLQVLFQRRTQAPSCRNHALPDSRGSEAPCTDYDMLMLT
jgi:hypothetical protein